MELDRGVEIEEVFEVLSSTGKLGWVMNFTCYIFPEGKTYSDLRP